METTPAKGLPLGEAGRTIRSQSSISPTRDATASLCRMLLADLGSARSDESLTMIRMTGACQTMRT